MEHNFEKFPELTNAQMEEFYWESPHKQITEDFWAYVPKVHDGDTISLRVDFRNFDFPIRFAGLSAPELSEAGGKASQKFMEERVLGRMVFIHLAKARVGKWGRLLGTVLLDGISMNEDSIRNGFGVPWANKNDGKFINLDKEFSKI